MWLQAEPPANRYSYLGIRFTGSQSCRDSCAYHRSLTRNEKNAREDGLKTHEMKRVSHFFLEYYDHANRITCVCVHVCVCWRCVCVRVRACARMCVRRWAQLHSLGKRAKEILEDVEHRDEMWKCPLKCRNLASFYLLCNGSMCRRLPYQVCMYFISLWNEGNMSIFLCHFKCL